MCRRLSVVICLLMAVAFGTVADDDAAGPGHALVRLSVACMRAEPRHGAELVSQALMGTPVSILGRDGEWLDVVTPDGYRGFIIEHSLVRMSEADMRRWRSAPRAVVCPVGETALLDSAGRHVSDLVGGCIVEFRDSLAVLPDGRCGIADFSALMPLEQWAAQPFDADLIIRTAEAVTGVSYLWGGLSSKGMDCSGLVRMCWFANGRLLPRDASQQALAGTPVSEACGYERGDLLFFGNPETGRITHVAIYDGSGEYIHSSQLVRRNSLDRESPLYLPLTLLGARRVSRLPSLAGHPDYFNRRSVTAE